MKVRLTAHLSGLRNGEPWPALGGEVNVPDVEGAELCAAGLAVPVAAPEKRETADAPVAEKRAPSRSRKE